MNLVLNCSEEDLDKLIKESIIEPRGDGTFTLYTKANLKGEYYPVTIKYKTKIINNSEVKNMNNNNHGKTLEMWYKEFRLVFPINASDHLGVDDGTNLRVGSKTKIKKSLENLMDEGYALQDIINAAKYEVWYRIKQSSGTDNRLEYMKRMQSWVNDINNVESMIERSKKSVDFKNSLNLPDDEPKSTRKINLA